VTIPDLSREDYYKEEPKETKPHKAEPGNHTMGKKNFLEYIGRWDEKAKREFPKSDTTIDCKKFSEEQKEQLIQAYLSKAIVRVVGAEKEDAEIVADSRKRMIVSELFNHTKSDRVFNQHRALMFWTKLKEPDANAESKELWILVFPSHQYVDQYAELVQAIFDNFEKKEGESAEGATENKQVLIWHFKKLEKKVADWTELATSLSSYVRHGDVVVIGNVDLLLTGIEKVGYYKKFPYWQFFGLNNMFGVQIMVNEVSSSRIVLLGVTECYWGEASSLYVEALLRGGACHILYASKAASMISIEDIHSVQSPQAFSTYRPGEGNQGLIQLNSICAGSKALLCFAELLEIRSAGVGVTVPTVIGETQVQRQHLRNINPSTMDDENGHIAKIVNDHNKEINVAGKPASFLPVHYISDYIYKNEEPLDDQGGLSKTNPVERAKAFFKIGKFFGIYATVYGLREYVVFPNKVFQPTLAGEPVKKLLTSVQRLLNSGMVREAIVYLSRSGIPSSTLQTIALICQKYGFIDDSLKALGSLKQERSWKLMEPSDQMRMRIVETKLLTQVGRFKQAKEEGKKILQEILAEPEKYESVVEEQRGSLYRRIALAEVYLGEEKKIENAFKDANKSSGEETKEHSKASNEIFQYIAKLKIRNGCTDLTRLSAELSDVRKKYLNAAEKDSVWQANPEKSALAALFVEAASYLVASGNVRDPKGLNRLFIAHLYNIKIGGSERSEGYGELIAFIEDEKIKDLVRCAMRIDGFGKKAFQMRSEMGFFQKTQQCLASFDRPLKEREEELQKLLNELDAEFG
jgi:hypothetical protein